MDHILYIMNLCTFLSFGICVGWMLKGFVDSLGKGEDECH
jgi:hypothetical protein